MKDTQILKIHGTDYKEMTKQLLLAARLEERLPKKEKYIGIKPNLVSPTPASLGATTHPEVVAGIIEYLQERGYQNILVMEGSWVGDRTWDSVEACGYDRLVEQYGVTFVDAQKEASYEADCAGMTLQLCDCVRRADFIINVPVLKGHCQTKVTCALKNMKGLLPNKEKRRFHALGLHKPIAHLAAGIHQDFIVADHICGDLDFEDGGNPVVCNCVMAAADPVLMDAYACHLLHYQVEEVPYIKMAAELGLGCDDRKKAEVLECERETGILRHAEVEEKELPEKRKIVELQDAVEEVESCSACYAYLIPALEKLKEEGLLDKLDTRICIGQGYQGKSGKLGVGRCTSGFEYCVKGCPPTEGQIYEFLKKYMEKRENNSLNSVKNESTFNSGALN